MASRLIRALPALFALALCHVGTLSAQPVDLRQDKAFFAKKLPEFRHWLRQNRLDGIFIADSLDVSAQRATLYLRSAHKGPHVCETLQSAWEQLEKANRRVNNQYFHERLFQKWTFLAELHPDQAEVVVRCHDPAHFRAIISSKNGRIPVEERKVRSAALIQTSLPGSLDGANTGDNRALIPDRNVRQVATAARRWLIGYYKPKGTPILWRARVDTSFTVYDEFIVEATHLSDEICPDGYFEYHRVYMKGVQKGADVELSWEFQGKYGSGILFPPRKNDYKDLETRYRSQLEDYQKRLFKKLLEYLRQ
jgi:hypothetical protein